MTYTNRSETVLKSQIIPIYFLEKNPRNSPLSVVELSEGKVVERRTFPNSNGYNSKTKEQKCLVHIFK